MKLDQIYNEDCLLGMRRIPDTSIDMILCDLPYGSTDCKWDRTPPLNALWLTYERILKPSGAIVLTAAQPFTTRLIQSNFKMFKYCWIWEKTSGTGFGNCMRQPLRNYEECVVFYSRQPTYNPQFNAGAPYRITSKSKAMVYANGGLNPITTVSDGPRFPKQIIKFNRDRSKIHPTQKPVALFEYLIRTYTNSGETVLDNCMGSGTTAIACINTGRHYIGFENDENYFQIAQKRIREHGKAKILAMVA